jgi:hypothetical protein
MTDVHNRTGSQIRKRLIAAVIGLIAAFSLAGITAGPAEAYPSNCGGGWQGYGYTYASYKCTSGTGQYQAWAQCWDTVWPHYYTMASGAWKSPNSNVWDDSIATCPFPYNVVTSGLSRRN